MIDSVVWAQYINRHTDSHVAVANALRFYKAPRLGSRRTMWQPGGEDSSDMCCIGDTRYVTLSSFVERFSKVAPH